MHKNYINKIIELRGDLGKKWLEELPGIIKHYEQKWNINCSTPFSHSYNYVAPAENLDGEHFVLKLSFPMNQEFPLEGQALDFYDGQGTIKVLQKDIENGAMLLEKAEPGTKIRKVSPDEKQISIASEVLHKMHKPVTKDIASYFPSILDLAIGFDRYKVNFSQATGPIPKWMLEKAEMIFKEFPKDNKQSVLLHGDLHSDNILLSQRGWLAIDPKGIVGESEFELGAYLRNPYYDYPKGSDYKKLEINKIILFAGALGFDKKRIRDWAFASAVISMVWFLEDEGLLKEIYIKNAELLHKIIF